MGTRAAVSLRRANAQMYLSCLSSRRFFWAGFMPVPITAPDKTATLPNICLLIIHSAGGQMAPGSYSLAPALINQLLQWLRVIADALKLNSLLYEVRPSSRYVKLWTRRANCRVFWGGLFLISRERIVTFVLTVRPPHPTPPHPSSTSKLKHVGAEKIKSFKLQRVSRRSHVQ